MGFRFRKSKNFGPFRINLSKSGVGFSAGVKGFRVTKKATGGIRTTASIPGTGISYVKDFKLTDKSPGKSSNSFEANGDIAEGSNTEEIPANLAPAESTPPNNQNGKSKTVEFVLCLLLGWLGIHKFYKRKIGMGILYLLTFGLFTVGWFGDTILLLISLVTKRKAHFGLGSRKAETIAKVGVYGIATVIAACFLFGGGSDSPSDPTVPTNPDNSLVANMDTTGTTLPAATDPTIIPTEGSTVPQTQPTMVLPTTEPLATEPPATTVPPTTEPPATEPPVTTVPPTTEPPATETHVTTPPPVTEAPATDPPVTEPPATESTGIIFLSWPQTTSRNEDVTVRIQGSPNTEYSIEVRYKNGPSSAKGLESKTSDANGYVSWTWHVGGNTTPGTFSITVQGGGQSETVQFTVVE